MRFSLIACALALGAGCYNPDLGNVGFYCHPDDKPSCPSGTVCRGFMNMVSMRVENRCQPPLASSNADMSDGLIPKTGTYTGTMMDPGLASLSACPDATLEPNDTPDKALDAPTPTPDMVTPKITKMAICPTGVRPETGQHDVDFFRVNTAGFSNPSLNLQAQVFYDITYGDLDVGIFDMNGTLLASDGTAVTNACTNATVSPGTYYVVVVGARNQGVNKYDIRIRTFTTPQQCPNQSAPLDMAF
jgi:hypothetical protein